MATSKKTEQVETKTEVAEETQQEETQQDAISDRRLILAPLARYGVVAIIIASLIVTTAIMLNKEYNQIDSQVATIEAELAQKNQVAEQEAIKSDTSVEVASTETTGAVSNTETTEAVCIAGSLYVVGEAKETMETGTIKYSYLQI